MSGRDARAAITAHTNRIHPETAGWSLFERSDQIRRLQGRVLDAFGFGPVETPYHIAFAERGVRLRAYGTGKGSNATLVIVPAPIKRPYIWDLIPKVSVVRRGLLEGFSVYLIEWEETPAEDVGLADFAGRFILSCLDAIQRETGQSRVFLGAHSLGGLLAALFASLRPERVQGLILLASPLRFGPRAGALYQAIARASRVRETTRLPDRIPGSFLSATSFQAAPLTFGWSRWIDLALSLQDPEALHTHALVERWTLDEFPLPRRLFEELLDLGTDDRFLRGTLVIGGKPAIPRQVRAPLLCVADQRCTIVPPLAMLPFLDATPSADKSVLWYEGDAGVSLQHVGVLVGRNAHRILWPQIVRWVRDRNDRQCS